MDSWQVVWIYEPKEQIVTKQANDRKDTSIAYNLTKIDAVMIISF